MRGKLIFVAGLATGYVLGSRAGRARYEQIKKNWLKVWETDAVQEKVELVEDFAKSRASELPAAVVAGVKKVSDAINTKGKSTQDSSWSTGAPTPADASSYTPPIPGQTGTSNPSTTN
ncbi:YtxH domain-containing protein [Mycetocola sp. 2940]|uniref:YtxH domain-containing protein n=1 Tax=Mycetocola sp. 2940 TaxID=3156452 RepID=UPI0033938AE8